MRCDNLPSLTLLIVLQLVLDHADHNFIADKSTLVHDLLGFPTERCLLCDLGSKHVASGLVNVSLSLSTPHL